MTETLVEYDCRDQIATLTLNRPDRLNAFSDDLVRHLMDALRRFGVEIEAPGRGHQVPNQIVAKGVEPVGAVQS